MEKLQQLYIEIDELKRMNVELRKCVSRANKKLVSTPSSTTVHATSDDNSGGSKGGGGRKVV
jgi:hypothetical protein